MATGASGTIRRMRCETVIATHGNTDFDAFASMLAARRLYPDAAVCPPRTLSRNVREFARLHADELELADAARLDLGAVKRLIVVDTVHADRLGELEPVARNPEVETVVFDHHADDPPDWAADGRVVVSRDGALTTTLVGVLAERELAVTPLEATAFALGIHEDTGSLTYPTTTQRDAEALAWCLRHGARQELVASFLHLPLGRDERELLAALIESLEPVEVSGLEVLVAAARWRALDVSVSGLAHKLIDLHDPKALACLVEMNGRVFCVLRSQTPELDAGALAAALGGGGHPQAASATFKGTLKAARDGLVDALPAAVREPQRARDVMSSPPRCVAPDDTVASAMVFCQRYGQSGAIVAEEGRLAGAVSREDLDKAVAHGLAHAPVKGIMNSHPRTCAEETPLPELQRLLSTSPDGRIAVTRDSQVVGVITRSDLLRAIGAEQPAAEPEGTLERELRRLEHLAPVFEAVAAVSEPYDGVYLVGGTVRDIVLGEPSFDVDIAVEGDAIALAEAIGAALGGRVRVHRKFGTAVVVYDGGRLDVVTARTEFYDAPAALPTVEHATIREDLFRRDFTINAMAASLKGEDFGRLVDPFGGRADLEERRIRVLHNLSFIDDPTRIFRAIRYESRLGFAMDANTQRLARGCIEMGLVGDLSSARLRDELVALLDEEHAGRSIVRLAELGADRAIHPHLAADAEAVELLERLRALRHRYDLDVPPWRLGLAALARRLPPDELYAWLGRLRVRRSDAERIAAAVTVGPRLVERLRDRDAAPADVVGLVRQYAPDAPLFALALADLPALHDYFARLRHVRLEIDGSDLARLGLAESPRVGQILGELRRRKLNGQLDGRDSELAAARELIADA
jgi:tRNA nucleotidyltransferase (CCA-adding enzyme)